MGVGGLSVNRLVPGLIEPLSGAKKIEIPTTEKVGQDFKEVFANLLSSVNDLHGQSAEVQKAFLAGEPVELHDIMIKAEQAGIATDLLLELRNKLVSAYQDLLRMPI